MNHFRQREVKREVSHELNSIKSAILRQSDRLRDAGMFTRAEKLSAIAGRLESYQAVHLKDRR